MTKKEKTFLVMTVWHPDLLAKLCLCQRMLLPFFEFTSSTQSVLLSMSTLPYQLMLEFVKAVLSFILFLTSKGIQRCLAKPSPTCFLPPHPLQTPTPNP